MDTVAIRTTKTKLSQLVARVEAGGKSCWRAENGPRQACVVPSDRMLIAQAIIEDIELVSNEQAFGQGNRVNAASAR